jgi:hypothetical protein
MAFFIIGLIMFLIYVIGKLTATPSPIIQTSEKEPPEKNVLDEIFNSYRPGESLIDEFIRNEVIESKKKRGIYVLNTISYTVTNSNNIKVYLIEVAMKGKLPSPEKLAYIFSLDNNVKHFFKEKQKIAACICMFVSLQLNPIISDMLRSDEYECKKWITEYQQTFYI